MKTSAAQFESPVELIPTFRRDIVPEEKDFKWHPMKTSAAQFESPVELIPTFVGI